VVDLLEMSLPEVSDLTNFGRIQAMRSATEFVAAVVGPLMSQIDPEVIGDRMRAMSLGYAYGQELLDSAGYLDEEKRDAILKELCFDLPAHGYVVGYERSSRLGLNATLATDKLGEAVSSLLFLSECEEPFVTLVEVPEEAGQIPIKEIAA
jgi:hypothetical protein